MKERNERLVEFARVLSEITGQIISPECVFPNDTGREYYTQMPEIGAPMLLHHYRGAFVIDMHPDDYKKIEEGEISPYDYFDKANWLVGYYWGGGSMVGGGYYQPLDIKKEEVKRYLQILACRGKLKASFYAPAEETCKKCSVEDCPLSKFKKGDWKNEMGEYDPRSDFFYALNRKFKEQFPEYEFKGFLCSDDIAENQIFLYPNPHFEGDAFSFRVCASSTLIRNLLMRKVTGNWDEYVEKIQINLKRGEVFDLTTENIQNIFYDLDFAKKKGAIRKLLDYIKSKF